MQVDGKNADQPDQTAFFLVFGHACHFAIFGLQYSIFEPMDNEDALVRKIVPPNAVTSVAQEWGGMVHSFLINTRIPTRRSGLNLGKENSYMLRAIS